MGMKNGGAIGGENELSHNTRDSCELFPGSFASFAGLACFLL